jgi:hypothetical protein
MMDKVKDDLGVCMNFTNALDYVPEAERNNRTIKEQVQAAYHRLLYKALPRQLMRYLVQTQASQLKLFPAKGGISPYYSLRTILGLPTFDYVKHCTSLDFPHLIMSNIARYHLGHTCRPTTKRIKQIRTHPEQSTRSTFDW